MAVETHEPMHGALHGVELENGEVTSKTASNALCEAALDAVVLELRLQLLPWERNLNFYGSSHKLLNWPGFFRVDSSNYCAP